MVNAASVGGLLAIPTAGHYVASKHAFLGLTKTAAVEYGRYGIRVNAVRPGAVRTEMLQRVFGSEEALDQIATVHPIGRLGRPEEIADAVAWLFSDRSSYYSGQSLTLDGGLSARRPVRPTIFSVIPVKAVLAEVLASRDEIEELVADLYRFARTPGTVSSVARVMQVWGYRPWA